MSSYASHAFPMLQISVQKFSHATKCWSKKFLHASHPSLAIKMLSWNGTHAFHALPCFEACCPLLPMLSHARKSRCISIPCFPCFTLRSDGEPKHGKHGNHGPTMVIPWFPCFVPCFFTRVLLQSKTLSRQLIVSYICQYHKFVYNSCSICLKSLSDSYSMVFH